MKNVTLLYGPNGGEIVVCGVFADADEAKARAAKWNALEQAEGYPASPDPKSPLLYSAVTWCVHGRDGKL